MRSLHSTWGWRFLLALLFGALPAMAADITAGPTDYQAKVNALTPGDTLHLEAGEYRLLSLSGLNGTETAPITITGPETGVAQFHADPGGCCNTVEIKNTSWLVLRRVTVNGDGKDGLFGVSAKSGVVHHITIEECIFLNHDNGQQTVAISTKVPTWGWVIRRNQIIKAGTGLYLGNSNGQAAFVGGLIEGNFVTDTVGYNMEIKYQKPRPTDAGLPTTPQRTIIRNNVFMKSDRPSPDGDRPNILVGGFPESGAGVDDRYEIYGNFFFHNPRESLIQASGRVSIYSNVFVDVAGTAILLRNHDLPLKQAYVYGNTIYGAGTGISVGSAASQGSIVAGNLVFANTPITGTITDQRDNITDTTANAAQYVKQPSLTLGSMDFYPLAGKAVGSAVDVTSMAGDTDVGLDFNGDARGGFTIRGAYAGEGNNPGWPLAAGPKTGGGTSQPDGGVVGAGGGSGGGGESAAGGGEGAGGGAGTGGGAGVGGGGEVAAGGGDASASDAGVIADGGDGATVGDDDGTATGDCGCTSGAGLALAAVALVLARRRRR